VTSQVVEVRKGKMATANKLAVLQKIKQEKGFLLGSFSNYLSLSKKVKNCKEVTELAEPPRRRGSTFATLWEGRIQILWGLKLLEVFGLSLIKRMQNYEYKLKCEIEYLFRIKKKSQ